MEHLPDPTKALCELFRMLAPGGRMICTVQYFTRSTSSHSTFFATRSLRTDTCSLRPGSTWKALRLEGFFGTCGYLFQVMFRYLPGNFQGALPIAFLATLFLVTIKALSLFAAAVFYRLDLHCKVTHLGFPKNYVIFAAKPDGQTVL
jgi:hypothetical protein